MKIFITLLITTVFSLQLFALTGDKDTKQIDASKSVVNWEGKKITGAHSGTISVSEGSLVFEDNKLIDGNITIDMSTMAVTDLTGNMGKKLLGHLQSDDFFGISNFPTATLDMTDVQSSKTGYVITGDLTIKGITSPVTFEATMTDTGAKATLVVDRTNYNIRYGSGKFFDNLGDKTIYDDFTLDISLVF